MNNLSFYFYEKFACLFLWKIDISILMKKWHFYINEKFKYNGNSIDFQLRDARTKEAGRLTLEQQKKIKIYKEVDFKPNRFIGFIKSDNSWHSVLPMELPDLVTRNCFQINVWECVKDE